MLKEGIYMVIFLTSSFVEYQPVDEYVPKPLDDSNGFADNLRKYWKENTNFLMFANNPSDADSVDHVTEEMYNAFTLAGFSIGEIRYFDDRSIEIYRRKNDCSSNEAPSASLKEALQWADVLYVAGGHGPTGNTFIKKCNLKEMLKDKDIFDGIYIGLSAGSVNAAEEAYLIPELSGESIDPEYIRFTDGLGLTSLHILPHIEYEETVILDGKHLISEIIAGDSFGRGIYMISDGSYFMIRNGITEFFGKGMVMENGITRPLYSGVINIDNAKVRQNGLAMVKELVQIFDSLASDYYDWVLQIDSESGQIQFFHVSDFMLENGIIPTQIDNFNELIWKFSSKLVVDEEKQPVVEQAQMSTILDEIRHKGGYVRTMHLDTESGIKAVNMRVNAIAGDEKRLLANLTDISMIVDHDWMTDEYSRSGFLVNAERLLKNPEYREGYSIVYTNIQGFKAVNDLLGTFSGDMVIFLERDVLIKELEPVLIARLESDHFALIVKSSKLTEETFDRLCHQEYEEESKRLPLLIRCGICHISNSDSSVQHMLDQAKLAENSIPADHGVAYAVCDEKMSGDYVNQRLLISELDSALEKGEFKTYYQPVVDVKTGEIVSAEALIRWIHPEKGMIPPGQFVPIYEKEGLITKIDHFMINRVLEFNIERMQKGKKVVPCAVNLSRVDFYDMKLLEMINQKVSKQENVQNLLKLEVTESAYAVLESDAISFLEEMKRLGLSLMLDDFGSGMSSLSTLESFEFDVIKLDMGFIRKIGKSRKAEGIINHTIGLSHDIGAKVVAEGVETEEQVEFLKAADCDMIQGYYFYKPMSEEEFAKLL